MEMNDDIQKEVHEWAPGFPAKPTMPTPEGYFDDLSDRILVRWNGEQSQRKQRRIFLQRWVAVAAVSAGILIGAWCWWYSPDVTPMLQGITGADAYAYVRDNISEFDALIPQEVFLPEKEMIVLPESSEIEEYLLEELRDQDMDVLF